MSSFICFRLSIELDTDIDKILQQRVVVCARLAYKRYKQRLEAAAGPPVCALLSILLHLQRSRLDVY